MKRKITLFLIVVIILAILISRLKTDQTNNLMSPGFFPKTVETTSVPTPSPTPTPKTYNFDSSTDLKVELDSINPQVLDADFK